MATLPAEVENRRELDRLNAFSDGVFAIAITLLVLSIEVPSVSGADLGDALRDLGGDFGAYFIGFAVIGMFWYAHTAVYSHLERISGWLVITNLGFLSMISMMPFTTALLGGYDVPLSVAVYAANVGLAATLDSMVDQVAIRQDLYAGGEHRDRRTLDVEGLLRPAIFLVSIPVAFVSTTLAQLIWLLLFVTPWASGWIAGRRPRR